MSTDDTTDSDDAQSTTIQALTEELRALHTRVEPLESENEMLKRHAIDSTGFDRDPPSRYYAIRKHYRMRSHNVTALVDVRSLYIYDIHCAMTNKHDAKIGPAVTGC